MAEKEKQTKRKQPVVKWVHAVVGFIVLALGVCVICFVISAAHTTVETWQRALVVVGILWVFYSQLLALAKFRLWASKQETGPYSNMMLWKPRLRWYDTGLKQSQVIMLVNLKQPTI